MKRYLSLLLALVMVVGMIPVTSLAAEEATTNSIVENFDDVAFAALDDISAVTSYRDATIAQAPDRTGNAVKLSDTNSEDKLYPEIKFAHGSTTHAVVEFDIYATNTTNISLRFGNSAVTAAFLQFRSNGVWIYRYDPATKTGEYELFSEEAANAKIVAKTWNTFRVEVTLVDGNAQTKLKVNGVEYGTSDAFYRNQQAAIDNFYVQAVSASQNIYIDNLKMTADPFVHTFENLAADAVPGEPFTHANMAKVTTAQKKSGTKSVELRDSEASGYPTLRLPTTKSSAFVAEFDFKVGSGSIQFRITNGASSGANTAYWIKTSGAGVYSYDQPTNKWVLMYTHSEYFVKWNTLRVEAGLEKAAIYLNGTKIFDAPRCGGTYGTNATTALDSIIFETGDNTNAKAHLWLDNVKAAPAVIPAVEVNFDDVVISAPIESVPADGTESGFVDPHNASIVKAPGGKEGNALYLAADGVTKPDFDYKFDFTEEFSYEFDFFVNGTYDAINFQSYTGCANTVDGKNDAYIFMLDDANGLKTLKNNGGWATISADIKPNLGEWNNIRVTVNADGEKQAVVYLNDVKVHSTGEFFSKGDPMYGLYICTGSQNQSAYIDSLNINYVPYVAPATATITWIVDGVETAVECPIGTVPAYEGTPAKAADDKNHYSFSGWDKEIVAATAEGATYTAQFTAEEHKGEWVTIQLPDLFNEGAEQRICDVCRHENIQITPKLEGVEDTEEGFRLVADVTVDALTVEADQILDLNGHTLTVETLVCFGGIVDSSEGNGKLFTEGLDLQGNEMISMPIYDSANGCYKFFSYELKNLGVRENVDGTVTYGFAVDFANADAYALLASVDCGVDVTMTLAYGETELPFVFGAELVKEYADLQAEYSAMRAAMMLTVSGLDALEAGETLSVTPAVEAAGAVAGGEAMSYSIPE